MSIDEQLSAKDFALRPALKERAMRRSRWALPFTVFIFVFSFSMLLDGRRFESSDSEHVYADARRVLSGEKPKSLWPPGQMLLFIPIVSFENHNPISGDHCWARKFLDERVFGLLSALSLSGIAVLVFLSFAKLGFSAIGSGWLALLCATGTILLPYGTYSFSEIVLAFTFCAALFFLLSFCERRKTGAALAIGAFLGYSILLKPNFALTAPFFGVAILWGINGKNWKNRIIAAAVFSIPVVLSILGILWYNYLRYGSWLDFNYPRNARFSSPLLDGLYGQLLSPGKSYFLYSPVLFLAFWGWREFYRCRKGFAAVGLLSSVVLVLLYAKWHTWAGEVSWGPRFLVPLTPFVFLPAGFALRRLWRNRPIGRMAVCAIGLVSVALQCIPATVNFCFFTSINNTEETILRPEQRWAVIDCLLIEHFMPSCSPLLGMPWLFKRSLDAAPYLKRGEFGHFSVKWTGEIFIPGEAETTLRARRGSDIRIKISGIKAIDTSANPPKASAALTGIKPGWYPLQAKFSAGSNGAVCVLEWRHGASGEYVPVPKENLRCMSGGESSPGLLAKYYLTPDFHDKWRERIDAAIDFDWRAFTPFDEWLRRGFPTAGILAPHPYPTKKFESWAFHLNAWPAAFLTGDTGPAFSAASICLGFILFLLAASLASLIYLTARGRQP
jgi:hypothetical protein